MRSPLTLARWAVSAAVLAAVVPAAAFGVARPVSAPRTVTEAQLPASSKKAEQVAGVVLVAFKDSSAAAVARTLGTHGLGVSALSAEPQHGFAAVHVPKGTTSEAFAARLAADPNVTAAAPDYIRHVSAYTPPNDPAYIDSSSSYAKSWWLRSQGVNAAAAWAHGYSDPAARNFPVRTSASTFKVAVIDTGFYMNHPDKGANIVAGKDEFDHLSSAGQLVTDSNVTPPPTSVVVPGNTGPVVYQVAHGTCTAGEVAAATNNGVGVASVGYDAKVVIYKVMGTDSVSVRHTVLAYIPDEALINAIDDATAAGCKVISMSLGGPTDSPLIQDAIDNAWAHGVVILAATGNDGTSAVEYPAADNNVVGVGSFNQAGNRSNFTDYGPGLDILAPGENVWGLIDPTYQSVYSTTPGYEFWNGTSMATPAAAGALAHLWRYQPAFTNAQIVDYVEHHSDALSFTPPNGGYGWGYLDMATVMSGYMADYPYLAAPALTTPATVPAGATSLTWNGVSGTSVNYAVSVDGSAVGMTTGGSQAVSLTPGLHTVGVQATSLFNWYDASSAASATVFAGTTDGATAPDRWAGYPPAAWSRTQTAHVTIQSRDATMGLALNTAEYRFSTDTGGTWSDWAPASFASYAGSPEGTQTLAADVPFGQDSQTADMVQFRVANAADLVGTSPQFTVMVDSVPPTGSFSLASDAPTVTTRTLPVVSAVTDAHLQDMRFSTNDLGTTWTAWMPYAVDTTVTLAAGRGQKTLYAQYRDAAGNVLPLSAHTYLKSPFVMSRIAGYNRYDTAVLTSRAHFATGTADTVIVATGANFADALSAAALAGSYAAPLLLTPTDSLWSEIPTEVARLGATNAIVVGGTPAVSAAAYDKLAALPGIATIRRIQGTSRYLTSVAIADAVKSHETFLGRPFADEAFLARGDTYPDALAASPLAYESRAPILLIKPTSIPSETMAEIGKLMPNKATAHLVVCGGTGAITSGVTTPLTAAGRKWTRVGSAPTGNRYDTAAALANYGVSRHWAAWSYVGVATGQNFPDALGGGVAAGRMGGLVLLTTPSPLSPACHDALWLQTNFVDQLDVFGGTGAVSPTAYNALHGLF